MCHFARWHSPIVCVVEKCVKFFSLNHLLRSLVLFPWSVCRLRIESPIVLSNGASHQINQLAKSVRNLIV